MQANKEYIDLLHDIKLRIAQSRYAAARLVNQEQLKLYYGVGKLLDEKITHHKWGEKVLAQIEADLKEQMPTLRGFSHRSLKKMRQFYVSYVNDPIGPLLTAQLQQVDNVKDAIRQSATAKLKPGGDPISPSPTGQLEDAILRSFMGITFTHHLLLLNKCKSYDERLFYMHRAANEFWSVDIMEHHIKENLFKHVGKLHHNFDTAIHADAGAAASELFKDQYLLDFLQLQDGDHEHKIEDAIVSNITEFILKMGKGFSFIGNQFRLDVDGHEFFIDLLFFNRILQRLVVFELKRDAFKPEYTGQLHFYLNVLDDKVKLPHEQASIGIILCREKANAIVQYSIRNMSTPMGVATYRNSTEPPKEIKEVLPDADALKRLIR
jgi:predicted nuclease of restriction endonuclease-like (RecB) superfamily